MEREGGASAVLDAMKSASRSAGVGIGAGVSLVALGAVGLLLNPIVTVVLAVLGAGVITFGLLSLTKGKKIAKSFGQDPTSHDTS